MGDNNLNSLGFAKPPSETRVVVAMSGGVDSSVCAALLHNQGYDVVGITLRLYDHGQALALESKTCCAGQDINDARTVAYNLGFPHYVLDYESKFRQSVIEDFADSYLRGQTPIPCIRCNQIVKFQDMLEAAYDLGADCMVTGHYIERVYDDNGLPYLKCARDENKDQSYFLFTTTREQLDFLRFPLGGWNKDKTRDYAKRFGLVNAGKPDSQDICFVPNGDYTKVVKDMRPDAVHAGKIVHIDGREIGEHDGIIHYTIGQRKGLGIGGGVSKNNEPLYVIKICPENNQVIVGPKEALARNILIIDNCNWLFDIKNNMRVNVKFRSTMRPVSAKLVMLSNDIVELHLDNSHYGISSGQAAVCYIDDRLIGGGWIIEAK